ncbi:YqeG family HAD IIIA-type phosphatase [Synechocystis sp. LKSZ1]|uniref:YqeG family HAD IIIA-type phosphatase n=1 Tax=Synechocystis sp. LKSZ1 TaxID=3144951 RepID=UPI00336BC75B
MTKAKLLQPDFVLGKTITHLHPEILQRYQLKGLVLDVDETLVPFRELDVSPELQQWVAEIRPQMPIWLVSNNLSEARIGRIAQSLDLPFLFGAAKPSRRKLRQAIDQMGLEVARVAMVGDRLFTDVLAGNRLGMFTILVEPMVLGDVQHPRFSIRNFEVWISSFCGVTLHHSQH